MRWLRILRLRARALLRAGEVDGELARELALHLEQLTRENIESGMDAGAARLAARRMLGSVAGIEDRCRDQRRIGWIADLRIDAVYAWRVLRKSPGFTALAVVTLAFGAGASIAAYALAEGLLLRSLPYPSPERLAAIYSVHARRGSLESVGQEDFRDWQAANTVFEHMAFTEFSQMTLTGLGDAERVAGRGVSSGFFETLGVPPKLGRWFTPGDQSPGSDRVILLSYGFWMRKLGGRPEAVGSLVWLNDFAWRIIGVMPASFRFNEGQVADYWTPIRYRNYGHRNHQYAAYARLKPGVTFEKAQAQMSEIARRMESQFPDCAGWGVRVVGLRHAFLEGLGAALQVFGAAALIVLLAACGNVASLLLARGLGRSREIAVRMALGAGRRRVVRLLLTESVMLASMGAAAGLLLAWWLLRFAIAVAPPWLQLGAMVSVSPPLVAFSIGLTLLTGLLTGLWPAWRGARADLQEDLKDGGASLVAGRRHARALHSLVVMEIALAVVLLTFAGLLTRSFAGLVRTNLGYRTGRVLTFRMPLPGSRYRDDAARVEFWERLLARLAALPGVVSASAADSIPLGGTYNGTPVAVQGQSGPRDWTEAMARTASVTPDYFGTLGIRLDSGRLFTGGDTAEAERVLIVNQAFARKLLPGQQPLDSRVRLGSGPWQRIVGVVADSRYSGPARPAEAEAYAPFAQATHLEFVALRTAVPGNALGGAVRSAVRELDPALPLAQLRTMQEAVDLETALPREMMTLVIGFAALALGMAALGLGGVMAYAVSRRRREIGLRMALGARGGDIQRAVMRDALKLILAGSAIGAAGALGAARLLESLLYGVGPRDPAVLALAPVVLGFVALLACLGPARQAASVEPMAALREP